ncbi:MAG: M13 family metallopeptidase [Chitinophagales bacterium]|nr:M13 family metallopeptidase [Chitinophagales bacterium]
MKKQFLNAPAIMFAAAILSITACTTGGDKKAETKPSIILSDIDSTIKPGDDFFAYINSKWINANPIPATESRWGSFNILDDNSKATLRAILQEDANLNAAAGTITQKVGDFWFTGMDSTTINSQGATPLKPYLDEIDAIKTADDVINAVVKQHKSGGNPMFGMYVDADQKNSSMNILTLYQSGLGMPDRDYYFRPDSSSEDIRKAYIAYISKLFTLIGSDAATADKAAATVMTIETEMASASMTLVEQRDPYATYNKMTVTDFSSKNPNIKWNIYLSAMGFTPQTDAVIAQPKFFEKLNAMVTSVSIDDWKTYLKAHLLNNASNLLSADFEQAQFDFYSKKLQGTQEMDPRWKRMSELANYSLGEALGQEYVKRAFKPEAKEKMVDLVANLKVAFAQRIDQLDWMSAETKVLAKGKLDKIMVKIGYPDKWKDYSSLKIDRSSFIQNVFNCVEFETNRMVAKCGKPVDKTEWGMSPQTVNAYYNPTNNEIVFPAAILQPPFFNVDADNAVNYGGIGAVIGHEITHGFDDQGRQYDADGNLKNWWTREDSSNFAAKTAAVSAFYSKYVPIDSININGDLTNGENIADQGGVAIALTAFQIEQKKNPQPEKIDGLTADERFFINYAQIWRGASRDDALRQSLRTNPHAPGKYRVLGTVSNTAEWYSVFGIKEGDKMYVAPENQTHIW